MSAMSRQPSPDVVQLPTLPGSVIVPIKPPSAWPLPAAIHLAISFSALAKHPAMLAGPQVATWLSLPP